MLLAAIRAVRAVCGCKSLIYLHLHFSRDCHKGARRRPPVRPRTRSTRQTRVSDRCSGARYHRPRQPPVRRQGRRRTASQLHLGPLPATDPYHHHATEGFAKASGDHRTSFAPETIATRRNKHDRTRQILRKINASDSCPAAHNGLVGGSSPPGPTTLIFCYGFSMT
jgi:hypothetical protein